jgi:Tfp pilus assembly protein PilO
MKKKTNIGLLLLLLAVFAWFAVVRGQIKVFSDRSLEAKVKNEEYRSYNTRLEDLKTIKSQGDAITQTLQSLYLAMPRESQIPEVLVMIESIGASSGVVFNSVTVGSPTADEVPVSLSFSGNLSSVTGFLGTLRNNVRTAIVKNQSMSAEANGNMTVTMQLGLIYQGE